MGEALDEVSRRGVPREAARDFLLGHMNVLAAVIFKETEGVFSDACNKAIEFGKPILMRDDWKRIFDEDEIAASINLKWLSCAAH
jgi:D-apionate oxidoisomerase